MTQKQIFLKFLLLFGQCQKVKEKRPFKELKIFDISGRLLVQKSITEKNEQISMDYCPGIYILQITNPRNHESQSFKLYKQ